MDAIRAPAFLTRWLERFFDIKPREFSRVHAFLLFLTTTSIFYTMGAATGDTLFLSRVGEGKADGLLPWVYVGTGLLTILLTWLYESAAEHFSRERFVVGVNLALALSLVLFRSAIRVESAWLYYALVMWLEACALVALMLFFSFAGDYFTTRDARRLYGYINGGIALGSILGGWAVERLAPILGDENLLYVCAILLAGNALWCFLIQVSSRTVEEAETEEGQDSQAPLKAVLSNRYLQIVIMVVFASQACGWLVDYQLKIVASRALREEALAVFFGKFYGSLGVAQMLVQFGLTGWLLRRYGVVNSLLVLPLLLCLSSASFFLHPVFMMAVAGNFIRLVFLETLDEPTQELLFLPLPARLRVRAQSFVEGMILPLGVSAAGLLLLLLVRWSSGISRVSLAALGLGGAWTLALLALRSRYRDTLASSLRRLGIGAPDLARSLDSADGVVAVAELLGGGRPEQQELALDLCRGRRLETLAPAVRRLVDSPKEEIALKAVEALGRENGQENRKALERVLDDPRPAVRAAAIAAVVAVDGVDAGAKLELWSRDGDVLVRAAVLAGAFAVGDSRLKEAALAKIKDLIKSGDRADRLVAAKALAKPLGAAVDGLLEPLLRETDLDVRREIVAACVAKPEAKRVPWLVDQLREPSLRPLAVQALESMPLSAVGPFIEILAVRDRPLEERALLLRVLGRFGGLRGVKALWEVAGSDEDVLLRTAAAETLLYMKATLKSDIVAYEEDGFLFRRLEEISWLQRAREEAAGDAFFAQLMFDLARLETRNVLFIMALSHEDHRIEQVEASLFGGTEVQKANALEVIEILFPGEKGALAAKLIGSLVGGEAGKGNGLSSGTIRRLMEMSPWVRVATRRYLRSRGVAVEEENMITGEEGHIDKLMARVSFLRSARLFEGVSSNYLLSLAKSLEERSFCKDEVLFSEGQKADGCYILCEGALRVQVAGREVARLGTGECIGEMALIESLPYSATAVAEEDVRVLRLSSQEFNNVLLTHPEITVALLRHVSSRLREALARSTKQ